MLYNGVRDVADRLAIGTAILHQGACNSRYEYPVRFTMTARDAVELCDLIRPSTAMPIHYEGWKHFKQGREDIERVLAHAPEDIRERFRWLPIGTAVEIAV